MYSTLPSPSRLQRSFVPSLTSFSGLSHFLRSALADEDSQQFSESMQQLALQLEAVVAGLRVNRRREHAAALLMDTLTVLRDHRGMVATLGGIWQSLYEYGAYLAALNNFRVQIGHWLLDVDPWDDELHVTPEDFGLLAWRTLGEGMLLADMYEQWLQREQGAERVARQARADALDSGPGDTDLDSDAPPARAWWRKLRL